MFNPRQIRQQRRWCSESRHCTQCSAGCNLGCHDIGGWADFLNRDRVVSTCDRICAVRELKVRPILNWSFAPHMVLCPGFTLGFVLDRVTPISHFLEFSLRLITFAARSPPVEWHTCECALFEPGTPLHLNSWCTTLYRGCR